MNTHIISQDVFDKIRSRFRNLEMGDPQGEVTANPKDCLLYTSPSPRDRQKSRMPSSA